MNHIKIVLITGLIPFLFSCHQNQIQNQKQKNPVVQNGYCTEATVESYNKVLFAAQKVNPKSALVDSMSVQSACAQYKSMIGSESCKLQLMNRSSFANEEIVVSQSSHNQTCEAADISIQDFKNVSTSDGVKADLAEDTIILSHLNTTVTESLKAQIQNLNSLKKASTDLLIVQSGQFFDIYSSEKTTAKPYCLIISNQLGFGLTEFNFKSFRLSTSKEFIEITHFNNTKESLYTQLNCFNQDGLKAEDLKLKDLKEVFNGLLKFEYVLNPNLKK